MNPSAFAGGAFEASALAPGVQMANEPAAKQRHCQTWMAAEAIEEALTCNPACRKSKRIQLYDRGFRTLQLFDSMFVTNRSYMQSTLKTSAHRPKGGDRMVQNVDLYMLTFERPLQIHEWVHLRL